MNFELITSACRPRTRMSVFRIGRLLLLFSPKITRYNGICKYTDDSAIIEPLPAGWKEITTTVASLRIDNIASAGLNISRRHMWELFMDGQVLNNGSPVKKKSALVKEGDVIDVDTAIQGHEGAISEAEKSTAAGRNSEEVEGGGGDSRAWKRGRVVVKQIGEQTRKGRWCVTLLRHKHLCHNIT